MSERVIFQSGRFGILDSVVISKADLDQIVENTNKKLAAGQDVPVTKDFTKEVVGKIKRLHRHGDWICADVVAVDY